MSRPARRPLRTSAVLTGLVLSAGLAAPWAPTAQASAPAAPGPATALVTGSCSAAKLSHYVPGPEGTASYSMPRNREPIAASANAHAQTARVYANADWNPGELAGLGELCKADASFQNVLHVGAGTTGLAVGAPVTLVATVDFGAVGMEGLRGEKHLTSWEMSGGYTVIDPGAPCTPHEENPAYCAPAGPAARFVADAGRRVDGSPANWYDQDGSWTYDREWSITATSNTGQDLRDGEYERDKDICPQFPCDVLVPDPSVHFPFAPHEIDHGPQRLTFRTTVGAALEVSGAVSAMVSAYDADVSAWVDGLEGLSAGITPADGFSGLELTLGEPPVEVPVDTTAPTVTATPSAPANEAGWHREALSVDLAGADDTGVTSLTWTVDGGEPVTVDGASASVPLAEDGEHTVVVTAKDGAGNTSTPVTTTVRLDGTAPTLHLPTAVKAVATGPEGARVEHAHQVTDQLSGATSSCTPASGSTFPVGTTTVSCTAVDGAGNTAAAGFPVTVTAPVLTPAQRIDALVRSVGALTADRSVTTPLTAHATAARTALTKGKTLQACTSLAQFTALAEQRTGRGLSAADAATLTASARAARTALGC